MEISNGNNILPGEAPMSLAINNNNQSQWKSINPGDNLSMPCDAPVQPEGSKIIESSEFQIISIDPCYVTSISSYKYETFKLSTAHVTRGLCEKGRLAQMKATTKLKRCRKPYQLPNKSALPSRSYHGRAASLGNCAEPISCTTEIMTGLNINRSQSNRVVTVFDDQPPIRKAVPADLSRSRSLEDLRSLAKTTTVIFDSPLCKQDEELDEVSNVLLNMRVSDVGHSLKDT